METVRVACLVTGIVCHGGHHQGTEVLALGSTRMGCPKLSLQGKYYFNVSFSQEKKISTKSSRVNQLPKF